VKYKVYWLPKAGPARQITHTLEEAIAWVRSWVESEDYPGVWINYEIRHDDGRRWYWEMHGRHGVLKVDNPPTAD